MSYQSGFKENLFAGQTIFVPGGGGGLGRCIAHELASLGASLILAGRTLEKLERTRDEIHSDGGAAIAVELDVRDVEQISSVFEFVRERLGSLDVLVNNAGLGANHPAEDITESDWDEMMDVNLRGLFFACQAAGRITGGGCHRLHRQQRSGQGDHARCV